MALPPKKIEKIKSAFNSLLAFCYDPKAQEKVFKHKNVALHIFLKLRTQQIHSSCINHLLWAHRKPNMPEVGVFINDLQYLALCCDGYQHYPDGNEAKELIDQLILANASAITAEKPDLQADYVLKYDGEYPDEPGRAGRFGEVINRKLLLQEFAVLKKSIAHQDAELAAYFKKVYQLVKAKNLEGLRNLIGEGGAGLEFAQGSKEESMGFYVHDENGDSLIERLAKEGDKDSLKFLADHFEAHFTFKELAFIGVDLAKKDRDLISYYDAEKIIYNYARGNHVDRVNEMLALFPEYNILPRNLQRFALFGHLISGNASETGRLLGTYFQGERPHWCLCDALAYLDLDLVEIDDLRQINLYDHDQIIAAVAAKGGYLKDPKKLVEFFAGAPDELRDYAVKNLDKIVDAATSRHKLSDQELNVLKNLNVYNAAAGKLKSAKNAKPKQQPTPAKVDDPVEEALRTLSETEELLKIFDETIAAVKTIPGGDDKAKAALTSALQNLKGKTTNSHINNLFSPAHPALKLAQATQTLVKELNQDPTKYESAIKDFEEVSQPYKVTWDWKILIGAVIGAVLGFVLGAMIGAAAGPVAAAAAIAGGVKGALIGATLFSAAAATTGALVGAKLAYNQDPVRETIQAAKIIK